MTVLKFTIDSILGGQSPLYHGAGKGQFQVSQAIDPETYVNGKPSGHILPVGYSKFSDTAPSGAPMWIVTDPTLFRTWVYADDGELYYYTGSLTTETSVGTPTSGAGNGMAYYNNYLYLATPTDISRYGPLDGSPAMVNTFWTGSATAGLAQTALVNTTYISTREVKYPNHVMHVHGDGFLYFLDYDSTSTTDTTRGKGMVHRIGTKYGTAGAVTAAGAADDGSAYNVLDLPIGVQPFALASYGNYLAILGTESGTGTSTKTGQSWLFLWDTTSDSFDQKIPIPSFFATAMLNINGALRIWGGTVDFGYQMYEYNGGSEVRQIYDSQFGSPPFAGAVDAYGNHVTWGAFWNGNGIGTTNDAAMVMSHAYQNDRLGKHAIHNTGIVDTLATLPVISALKHTQQAQTQKHPVIGWRTSNAATYGLSKLTSAATKDSVFRSEVFQIDKSFKIREVRVPLTSAVASGLTITPKIYYDNASTSKTLSVINNTNYPSARQVKFNHGEIEEAVSSGYIGRNNFFLELSLTGTSATGVALPIEIIVETIDD